MIEAFCIISLLSVPVALLLNAWVDTQIKSLPAPRELTEVGAYNLAQAGIKLCRVYLAEVQRREKVK
jgi:hypothetical protein